MLKFKNLAAERGDRLLFSELSLQLNQGELLHIHGENGAGKTTLLRMLCGLSQPTHGNILWNDDNIHEARESFSSQLLYIGHKGGIKDDLTATENLRVAAALHNRPINNETAWDALAEMGLKGFEDIPSGHLSQGQKRRVALAQLLLSQHKLWILDEPFVTLDLHAVKKLQSIIQHHIQQQGMVILTTHQEVEITGGDIKHLLLGKLRTHGVAAND